jgi:hypothetical protein
MNFELSGGINILLYTCMYQSQMLSIRTGNIEARIYTTLNENS